jgi:hypothetical protein
MIREELERLLESGNEPISPHNRRLLLAEFDRLKLKVASLAADLWDAQAALDEEQNWLGTISEPMNKWRQGATDIADAIELTNQAIASYLNSQKPSEKSIPRTTQGWKDRIWPEKPSEKPKGHFCEDGIWEYIPKSECQRCNPKCEHKNLSGGSDYLKGKRCLDCGEWIGKSLTKCPECIWGQKRREFTAVEGAYCKYVVYERCPRCKGEGRISC